MVLQKLWVLQNFSPISLVSQSRFLSGYVCLAVPFFIQRCLKTLWSLGVTSKKSKCLGLAKKNASLAVSQSLSFTIRHPSHMCTWKISGFLNEASCAVYFTSSIINFSFHSDLILENAKEKDVAFLVVGDPFGWVTSEYHYSMHNGTILTVDIQRYFHLFGSW